jgi:hypothetical protein
MPPFSISWTSSAPVSPTAPPSSSGLGAFVAFSSLPGSLAVSCTVLSSSSAPPKWFCQVLVPAAAKNMMADIVTKAKELAKKE